MPQASLPAFFIHGREDPIPLRSATDTAGLIPGAKIEIIADCGHFPWLEKPAEFRAAVERFLN